MARKSLHFFINKFSYKTLLSVLFILLIAVVVLARFIFPNQKVSAAWWNEGWEYRKSISITNTTNYNAVKIPHKIFIDTQSLISTNKLLVTGNDFRVVDATGNLVKFQVEKSTLNTSKTGIWIETNINSKSTALYYLYYGNSFASPPTFTTDLNTISNTATTVTVEMKDGFGYSTTSAHGRISDIRKNGSNLGVDGNIHYSDSYPGNWWDDRAFTQTILASGPLFVEVKYEDSNYGSYSSFGSNIKIFNNGFAETRLFTTYNTSGSESFYYYLPFDNGTRNSVWINGSGTLIDQDADSGNLVESSLGQNWFGQRWTATGIYGGTIITKNGSDWTNGGTSTRASYYQTNYSYNQAFVNGTQREVRFGVFTGNGGITEMQQKGAVYGALTNSLSTEELSPAPVAYWKFDEGVGTSAYDSSLNKNDGTISGATWVSEDQCTSGKCLAFNGSSSYTNVNDPINNSLDFGVGDFTVEFWINYKGPTAVNQTLGTIVNKTAGGASSPGFFSGISTYGGNGSNYGIVFSTTNGAWGTGNAEYNGAFSPNTWYHVTGIRSGTTFTIYKNGKNGYSRTISGIGVDVSNTQNLKIGGGAWGYLNALIDDVKIFPYARTLPQIKSDYAAGLAHTSSSKGSSTSLGSSNKNSDFLSNGLVGYWKMDENTMGNGTTFIDSSGNSNTGTGVSSVAITPGKFGNGADIPGPGGSGLGSVINVNDSDSLDVGYATPMTISFWLNADSTACGAIIKKSGLWEIYRCAANLTIRFDGYDKNSSFNLNNGQWYFVTVTRDNFANTTKVYINGQQTDSWTYSIGTPNYSGGMGIGAYNGGSYAIDGKLDEVRIYNRALSPSEVSSLYNWAPGPIGYWRLDDHLGTVAADSSGNNNPGTLISNPLWVQGKFGGGLQFSGGNDVDIAANPIFNVRALTISSWIKTPSTMGGVGVFRELFSKQGGTRDYDWYAYSTNGVNVTTFHFSSSIFGGNLYTLPTPYQPNTWHYATFTQDETGKYTVYSDGVPFATGMGTPGYANNNYPLHIAGNDNYWNGIEDDVKLYNYARTGKQVIEDMNGGHPIGGSPVGSQVGYWKFDEGFGSSTFDWSSQKNNATITNATWTTDGKFNKALNFNGSNSVVSIGTSMPINNEATFTGWFKINSFTDWASVFGNFIYGNNTAPFGMNFVPFNGFIRVCSGTGSGAYVTNDFPSTEIVTGKWIYGALVYNGTQIKVYINGKMIGSATRTVNQLNTPFAMGRWATDYSSNYYFPGTIDEVKIYNSALTDDEIKIDYNRNASMQIGSLSSGTGNTAPSTAASQEYCIPGDTFSCSSPVAEWKMDEKTGTIINDTSGNNLNGTLVNNPSWIQGKIGSALNFNGGNPDNYISTPFPSITAPTSYTAEAWINPNDVVGTGERNIYGLAIMAASIDGSRYPIWLTVHNSEIRLTAFSTAGETVGANIQPKKWYHIAVSATQNGTATIYINGINKTSFAAGNTAWDITDKLVIGDLRADRNISFDGKLDQIRIYNYVRTPAQIAWDYNKGGPVGQWKFDECQSTTAYDWSGIGNTGTISIGAAGSQTAVGTCSDNLTTSAWNNGKTGKYNSSLNFDGTDDRVVLPNDINLGTQEFTVSTWVNHRSFGIAGSSRPYVSDWNSWAPGAQKGFVLRTYDTQSTPSFWLADGTNYFTLTSSKSLTLNTWYHIVGVFKASSIYKIYINGIETGSAAAPAQYVKENTSPIYIGYGGINAGYMDGQIDDTKIFNYALTSTQIKTLYNNGAVNFSN